jgi:hypothetical protein
MATKADIAKVLQILDVSEENFTERNVSEVIKILTEQSHAGGSGEYLFAVTNLAYIQGRKLGLGRKDSLNKAIDKMEEVVSSKLADQTTSLGR